MILLGIESSCDETSAAIIEGNNNVVTLKANTIATSLPLHAQTGGIIPENAAREQLRYIMPVLQETLTKAQITFADIDAFAVTYGPGLIGSLLVGVETAKTLSYVLEKPLIPINHMVGHIYANFIDLTAEILFPVLALVVSGGHTDLVLMEKHGSFQLLGGTRDDAAGEAFDKIGRLLGLDYPAGPIIEQLAKEGDPKRFRFPRPLIGSDDYDFSFSGLKTAVLRETERLGTIDTQTKKDLARATQDAIIDVLTKKTLKATKTYNVKSLLLSGGVAANETLKNKFVEILDASSLAFYVPPKHLCTDNAGMIAAAAYYLYHPISWHDITANPELYF